MKKMPFIHQANFLMVIIAIFPIAIGSYMTWDGKTVPLLPPPPGNAVVCSTAIQLYMALRTQTTGKTILLKDGTYNTGTLEPLRLDSSHITIRGLSGDPTKVVINGNGFESCTNVDEEMFMLYTSHTTFADITIAESRCHGIKFQGGKCDSTLVHNVRFYNICERAIKCPGDAPNPPRSTGTVIRYCHFEDTKIPSPSLCGVHFNGEYIAGMDVMDADSWVVHDCVFRNIRGANGDGRGGIFFWGGSSEIGNGFVCRNMVAERNTFVGCDRAIAYGNSSGVNDVEGGIIRNNFIVRGAGKAIEVDFCTDIQIYNNTVYSSDPTYSRAVWFESNFGGIDFKNNIVFGNVSGSPDSSSNNLIRNSSGDASTNWFTDRTNGDLHLTANATQAINTGASGLVVNDWDGHMRIVSVCDIGADEFGSTRAEKGRSGIDKAFGAITVLPNPFNPSTRIAGSLPRLAVFGESGRQLAVGGKYMEINIYTVHGKLVQRLPATSCQLSDGLIWDASDQPSGVYVVTIAVGNRQLSSMAILQK